MVSFGEIWLLLFCEDKLIRYFAMLTIADQCSWLISFLQSYDAIDFRMTVITMEQLMNGDD